MDASLIDEIIACMPRGRTVYRYARGEYAPFLLGELIGEGMRVRDIKRSPYAPLLRQPPVQQVLGRLGNDWLRADDLHGCPAVGPRHAYRLTLGRWPLRGERWDRTWHQMVRRGANLVLQLNASEYHNRVLRRLSGTTINDFHLGCHPVAPPREFTLAWCRMEIDFERDEALIEEIQSDWARDVVYDLSEPQLCEYRATFSLYLRHWQETMLAAAIWFLRREIDIGRIFYYTYESGNRFKRLRHSWRLPPRSIYSQLPRRFCFRLTHNGPLFLRDNRTRYSRRLFSHPDTQWFVMQF
jgi:hypothetical protein